MKNKNVYAAIGIVSVTVVLLIVNRYVSASFIKDYALILIIAGMFLGIALGRIRKKR